MRAAALFAAFLLLQSALGARALERAPGSWGGPVSFSSRVRPLDWKELLAGPEQVVFFGENHYDERVKRELAGRMAEIKEAGFTHIAVEFWKEDSRLVLESYSRREAGEEELLKASGYTAQDLADARTRSHALNHIRLLREARQAGLELLAPDVPEAEQRVWRELCENGRVARRCDGSDRKQVFRRDRRMAAAIAGALRRRPGARVLALVGAAHAGRANQPAALERRGPWKAKSYLFSFGSDGCGAAVKELGLQGRAVFIELGGSRSPRIDLLPFDGRRYGFDGCLSLPGA